jgi:hypothetical protein
VVRCQLADHVPHLMVIKRSERDQTVIGAHPPSCPELRPGGDENEQRRKRSTFGNAAQKIKRGRIGPMHIFQRKDDWLRPPAGDYPFGQCPLIADAAIPRMTT